ncbi:IclR family transcriptional regulator C-terminal domain-containing protein [Pseudonocardia sp. KRD291]|uniref:IclR family transcriptional regulator domain-containing protein n=1 Tax=Pseudonocardia sp. KRD291 TaxID=2792007 RepID=UPI001C4A4DE1|nr:IclR family transcriptional regulator C-terminal domain-containing protein [Pseudonocardia sp. KRD291]MBW0101072.1 helix-turn-helix domain-containing protein [Pseudonocardia sp. KRD291]
MSAMITPGTGRDRLQSLERGLAVLRTFDAERPSATVAELAAATALARPTVRRILLTLQDLGYIENSGSRWRLTPRVLSIGQHYSVSNAVIETAQPHLLRLAEQTGESASLAALDGTEVVYIARVPVRRIMSINIAVGTRVPAHATSMGRALLAWAPPETIQRVIETTGLPSLTPHTVTDSSALRSGLRRVREQGWSVVSEELELGLISASAPVRDPSGTVIAALASSSSTGRSTPAALEADVVPRLLTIAGQISADLGYREQARTSASTVNAHEGFF